MRMKNLIKLTTYMLICVLLFSISAPVYATAVVSPPAYAYGLNSVADDQSEAKQMLRDEWENWKDNNVSQSGRKRVLSEDNISTLSEGMGYGLLLSVYFNEQTLFDEFFEYVKSCYDSNGLMNWKTINGTVTSDGSNSSTDADQNIALSLIFADKMWGSDGQINYETEAKTLLSKIRSYCISAGNIKPGDAFSDPRNPSYLTPGWYEIFNNFDIGGNWNIVKTNSYSLIRKAQNSTTGLVPGWCNLSGQGQIFNGTQADEYGFESIDLIWNMAVSYSWYGHTDAKAICSKLNTFFRNIGAANIVNGYKLNGTPTGGYHSPAFVACAAAGFMTGTDKQLAKTFYEECLATESDNYYDSTLRLFTLMYMTGNLQNLYENGNQIVEGTETEPADPEQMDTSMTEEDVTDETAPESPVDQSEMDLNITLTGNSELGYVKLAWDSIEGIQGYYIYKSTRPGGQNNTPETDFWITGTTYKDTKIKSGIKYYYIVKPVKQDKSLGPASNEVCVTTWNGNSRPVSIASSVKPQSKSGMIQLTIGNSFMKVNGKSKEIDPGKGTSPVITNGRAFMPFNAIIVEMGGTVVWNSKEQKITIRLNENTVDMWMGKTTISVNGVKKTVDVAPYLSKSGRQMLPLRFVADNLGLALTWEGGSVQKATIIYEFN